VFADRHQIDACKDNLRIRATTFSQLSKVLALAGNEVRLKIMFLLEEEGELCPCDLSDILGMSIPAISQHLRKMKDGNIVKMRRSGQTLFYSLKQEHIDVLNPVFDLIIDKTKKEEIV
jgi:DNA-binding transcriptional ArsR family regulator